MAPDSSARNKGCGGPGLIVPAGGNIGAGYGGNSNGNKDGDIENGNGGRRGQLYPGMMEDPRMRWAFIRKVYVLLCLQLLVTSGLASAMFFVHPINAFMKSSPGGLITVISSAIVSFIFLALMSCFKKKHPWNLIFMGLFTLAMGCMVGAVCAYQKGIIVLEAAGLTALVTVSLTLYTFWGARRGQDFSLLGPFLFSALFVLIGFALIRIVFPMGKWGQLIAGCVGALIFSGFIIFDTNNLIKHYDYDAYIVATCALYLDILNLFLHLLQAMVDDSS